MAERKSLEAFIISPIQKKRRELSDLAGNDFYELIRGEDGRSPEKGKDYFTEEDKKELARAILSMIPTPQNGIDGEDGKDGKDGRDGKDADEDAIVARLTTLIPVPENGKDADEKKVAKAVLKEVKKFLPKEKQLTASEIAGLEEFIAERIETLRSEYEINMRKVRQSIISMGGPTQLEIKSGGTGISRVVGINFVGATVTPTGDGTSVDVSFSGSGGSSTPLTPTGTVNGSNRTFGVASQPKSVISDGITYFEGLGYSYSAPNVTLEIPPSQYIRYYA